VELEKNLLEIVDAGDDDDISTPSTVHSPGLFSLVEDENEEKARKSDKFLLSSVLKDNWRATSIKFKFIVFDRIVNENKLVDKKKPNQLNNSLTKSKGTSQKNMSNFAINKNLYEFN